MTADTNRAASTPPCLMTLFGATGDLMKRLLLPSLYNLVAQKMLPEDFRLLGVAMEPWDETDFRQHIEETLPQFWGSDVDPGMVQWLTSRAFYRQVNFDQPTHGKGYERLLRDVMLGDATLFPSAAFVEQGWKLIQPLLESWQQPPLEAFPNYAAGSAGPEASDARLARNGHQWQSLEQA